MVDAVRYLVTGGITWRARPADFPAWDRVYAFFRRWRDKGLTAELHDRLHDRVREAAGRDPGPTAGVIDAQPVRGAASVPAATRGFDGGKKVNGRKRHIVVDILGLLPAVMVTTASVTDRDAGQTLLARLRDRHWHVTRVWADGGCTGRLIDFARDAWRIALTVIRRALPYGPGCRQGVHPPGRGNEQEPKPPPDQARHQPTRTGPTPSSRARTSEYPSRGCAAACA
ncbi:transposase [Streptomyces sp. NPDC015350]